MSENKKILLLPGDGIGQEVIDCAKEVLVAVEKVFDLNFVFDEALIGGCALDRDSNPLPKETLNKAFEADAILLGAVGGPKWDNLPSEERPERGLLRIRSELDLFANLRPAILSKSLVDASSMKPEVVSNLDILIIRELTGGLYFSEPRGRSVNPQEAFNTMRYSEEEILRIGKVGFEAAKKRGGKLCSVDKANVLEVSALWREIISELGKSYTEVDLSHMLVDNAAMQLVREPKQFDVIVTGNIFGDILSDISAMLTGSIGMLPSASLNETNKGLYEPVHGSAPDIAGKSIANPIATIMSAAMMLKYSFGEIEAANSIKDAIEQVLQDGYRTIDIANRTSSVLNTTEMSQEIIKKIKK